MVEVNNHPEIKEYTISDTPFGYTMYMIQNQS